MSILDILIAPNFILNKKAEEVTEVIENVVSNN